MKVNVQRQAKSHSHSALDRGRRSVATRPDSASAPGIHGGDDARLSSTTECEPILLGAVPKASSVITLVGAPNVSQGLQARAERKLGKHRAQLLMTMVEFLGRKLVARSDRGTAMMEFAIIAPVFLLMVFGIADLAMMTMAKFKSNNAATSAADLATQAANLQATDMADVYAGAADVMAPYPNASLAVRITSIASDGNGHAFVHWSCGQGALPAFAAKNGITALANGDPIGNILNTSTFAGGGYTYNGANTSVIQVESQYVYSAPTQFFIRGPQTMRNAYYIYPRQTSYIGFVWDGNANDQPPTPTSATHVGFLTLSNGANCNYTY